jgi:hypothetical protein
MVKQSLSRESRSSHLASDEFPRWLTPREAAYLIGIEPEQLGERLKAARIVPTPLGRRKRAQFFFVKRDELIRARLLPGPARNEPAASRLFAASTAGRRTRLGVGKPATAWVAALTVGLALAVSMVAPTDFHARRTSLQATNDFVQAAEPTSKTMKAARKTRKANDQRVRERSSKSARRQARRAQSPASQASGGSRLAPSTSGARSSSASVTPGSAGSPSALAGIQSNSDGVSGDVYRAFAADSEWNRPLSNDAPIDPLSGAIIAEIKTYAKGGYPRLVTGTWAEPIYWGRIGDPMYTIKPLRYGPTLKGVHIPRGAKPAATSDGQMTVFDLAGDTVFKLTKAIYDSNLDRWTATGTSQYSLGSKGLACALPESDRTCPMNSGHRGYPPAIHAVRYDEVSDGVNGGPGIQHVLKVALDRTAACHVYPGAGHESGKGGVLTCEGLVLRIKPSVNLDTRRLSSGCMQIATALQRYGAVIGDTGGVAMAIKVENLAVEGRHESWSGFGVSTSCFRTKLTFDDFQVIARGYHRP